MADTRKDINRVCKFAQKFERRRGDIALCFKDKSENEMLVFVNFPDRISNIPDCVATKTFSTGHATPDSCIEIDEMYKCPFRKEQ